MAVNPVLDPIAGSLMAGAGIASYHPLYTGDPFGVYQQNVFAGQPSTIDEFLTGAGGAPEFGESFEDFLARSRRELWSQPLVYPERRGTEYFSGTAGLWESAGFRTGLGAAGLQAIGEEATRRIGDDAWQGGAFLNALQLGQSLDQAIRAGSSGLLSEGDFSQTIAQSKAAFESEAARFDELARGAYFSAAQAPPLPHHINPIVWDALGPVGQELTLGASEAFGFDPREYERQLNASRPMGTAPRQTRTRYAAPRGMF